MLSYNFRNIIIGQTIEAESDVTAAAAVSLVTWDKITCRHHKILQIQASLVSLVGNSQKYLDNGGQ